MCQCVAVTVCVPLCVLETVSLYCMCTILHVYTILHIQSIILAFSMLIYLTTLFVFSKAS